jgi:hypothetical protein
MSESTEFLSALAPAMPEEERLILCGFPGDPAAAPPEAWKPRPWRPGARLGLASAWNAYVTVSSFRIAPDRTWRRRKSLYAAGHALMVDDVGTKIPPDTITLPPSAIIETSPSNYQHWYILEEPEPDAARFDALIRAFIAGKLLGQDPGMSGVTRVGRLPGFRNGKPKCKGFTTRLHQLTDRSYSIPELVERFGLELRGRDVSLPTVVTEESLRRNRAFVGIYKFLQARGMLKHPEPDTSGWTEMTCPWLHEHTGGIDNGAAICEPNEVNGWSGAFRCHHGSHINKHWKELCEWVNDLAAEELDAVNRRAQ